MKFQQSVCASLILAMLSAPVMARVNFENQIFEPSEKMVIQELSQQEMKETEGAVAPLVAIGILQGGRFIAQRWVTQRVAAQALARGANVYAKTAKQAQAVANQAWGKQNVIRHGQKELHANYSHFQHVNQKVRGHVFYGNKHR